MSRKTAATAEAVTPEASGHGRTPDNTPLPGGGSWSWDAEAGAWVDMSPKPADPPQE